MELTKKAADVIEALLKENEKLAKENHGLKQQQQRDSKMASIRNHHGLGEDFEKKIASMNENELKVVETLLDTFPANTNFAQGEQRRKKASDNTEVSQAKKQALDFLNS
jgi:hypothetical protein